LTVIELANAKMSQDVEDTSTCPVFASCEVCEHDSNDSNDAVKGSTTPSKKCKQLVRYRKDWENDFPWLVQVYRDEGHYIESLFDIAHHDAFRLIKIEEDRHFLEDQRSDRKYDWNQRQKLAQVKDRRQKRMHEE